MKNKCTLIFILSVLLAGLSATASAQATKAADYYFTAKKGTFSFLKDGTELKALKADDAMTGVDIGFTFTYCGTDFKKIYAGTNGFLSFEVELAASDYAWPPAPSYYKSYLAKIKKGIMPLWEDLGGTLGVASYTTSGTEPNRILTIEYKDWGWDFDATKPSISFQVRLYETTNIIQFIYNQEADKPTWYATATPGGFIGISGGSSDDFLSLSNSSTSPSASSTTFTNDILDRPASGQIYEFSPSPQCAGKPSALKPNGPAAKVCSGEKFTLVENVTSITIGNTYQWQSSPAGAGTFTDVTDGTSRSLTTTITANTDFRLITTCTVSGLSSTSAIRTVEVLAAPTITSSGATSFCSNQLLTLYSMPDPTYTYQWIGVSAGSISGAKTYNFDPKKSDRYTLKVSTASCTSGITSKDTITVEVKPAPTAAVSPSPSVTICSGENTTLTGTGTGDYQWFNTAGSISGATATTYKTSAAGKYMLVITNPANGCMDTADITEIISTPPPTVLIGPADSINICTGLSTTLNSKTTGSGLSYQWYNSAGLIPDGTDPTLSVSAVDKYVLVVTAGSCKDTSNTIKLHLLPLPPAKISSVGTTLAICPTATDVVLQANTATGYSYQWLFDGGLIGGATGREQTANTAGSYNVKITDGNGCIKYSDTFKIFNSPSSKPDVSPKEIYFCEGNEIMFYSNPDKYYTGYQWYKNGAEIPGETGKTYNANTSGLYSIQITDSFKCVVMSAEALAVVNPKPAEPKITQTGKRLGTTPYKTYQWFRNGKALSGANSRFYELSFDGTYFVEVSNENGCFNRSAEFIVERLGIASNTVAQKVAAIFPNPAANRVHIEYGSPVNVLVKDIQGRQILNQSQINDVDMSTWADGLYFFLLTDKNNNLIQTEKVVKRSN